MEGFGCTVVFSAGKKRCGAAVQCVGKRNAIIGMKNVGNKSGQGGRVFFFWRDPVGNITSR